jgi:ribosome assembly protein YihI (activator of Der GTPase)
MKRSSQYRDEDLGKQSKVPIVLESKVGKHESNKLSDFKSKYDEAR